MALNSAGMKNPCAWYPIDLCGIMDTYVKTNGRVGDLEDVQKGLLAWPQRAKGRGVLFLYVEPRNEVRTQPEAFFNIRTKGGDRFRRGY